MIRKVEILGVFFVAVALMAPEAKGDVNCNWVVKDRIKYYMQTDKAVYVLGENVEMLYRVTNLRDTAVTFKFTSGPIYDRVDYTIEKDGVRIWDNLGRPSQTVMTSFILWPSQSRSFTKSWDMTDLSGNQVAAGNYDVTGVLYRWPSHERYVPVSVQIEIIAEPIEAIVDIEPDVLNLNSRGKWITCHIWLDEEEYNVADIDPNSVRLEGEIEPGWIWFDEEEQVVMAKFSRAELQEILEAGEVELTVTGELTDGTRFKGTDTIKVIDRGRKKE